MSIFQTTSTPLEKNDENLTKSQELEKLREKKKEIEFYIPAIEQSKETCHQLVENIQYQKKKIESLNQEIKYRKKRYEDLLSQYNAITDKRNMNSKDQVTELKKKIIREKLEELLADKIPEAELKAYSKPNEQNSNNEFKELIHENIKIILSKYESPNSKKLEQIISTFRISNITSFSALKSTACKFWNIENPNEYLITDESESIIYNEEMKINEYMKNYSVRSNLLKLIKTSLLNSRIKITPLQDSRLKELNQFKAKSKGDNKRIKGNSSNQIRNDFIKYYQGLTPYYSEKKKLEEKHDNLDSSVQSKNLNNSLIMLILTILFFAFTTSTIYRKENDILLDKRKIDYLYFLFDNKDVTSPFDLGRYLLDKILGRMFSNKQIETTNNCICDKDNFTIYRESVKTNGAEEITLSECLIENQTVNNSIFPGCGDNDTWYINISEYNKCVSNKNTKAEGIVTLSSIHIVIEKVKSKNCYSGNSVNHLNSNKKCFETDFNDNNKKTDDLVYDESITNTSDINDEKARELLKNILDSFKTYKSRKEANVFYDINTYGGNFNGDGYHADFPLSKDIQ